MSAAETYVDILEYTPPGDRPGRLVNMITESGQLEFFMIAASTPRRIHKRLSTVTGFPMLPPLFSLGFHYSRWETTSAYRIMEYNMQFEENGFPVDVFWMDIGHTLQNMYFTFNPTWFNDIDLEDMRDMINVSDRRLVVITDPHIKESDENRVYNKGFDLEQSKLNGPTSIFVKTPYK